VLDAVIDQRNLLPFSAHDSATLENNTKVILEYVVSPNNSISDVAYTLARRVSGKFQHRGFTIWSNKSTVEKPSFPPIITGRPGTMCSGLAYAFTGVLTLNESLSGFAKR
jgi:hypothetical protein